MKKTRVIAPLIAATLTLGLTAFLPLNDFYAARAAQETSPQEFSDGPDIYYSALEALEQYHVCLSDAPPQTCGAFTNRDVQLKWSEEWANKHANDHVLDTEAGTDRAVEELILSLGQRFDYYYRPAEAQQEVERFDANHVGIGAEVHQKGFAKAILKLLAEAEKTNTKIDPGRIKELALLSEERPLEVVKPVQDGPAAKVGLQPRDVISKIDGRSLNGMTEKEAVKLLRDAEGTHVVLTVLRSDGHGGTSEVQFDVVRGRMIDHVVESLDLGDDVRWIKLSDFISKNAEEEMARALTEAKHYKAIVVDLRNNPGGRLPGAEIISSYFLNSGPLTTVVSRKFDHTAELRVLLQPDFGWIVLKNSGNPEQVQVRKIKRDADVMVDDSQLSIRPAMVPEDQIVIVLINGNSASGAEFVAKFLQANHRATVVGVNSRGKGVGQTYIRLPRNRVLHITNFEFLPAGQPVDWEGVIPDIEVQQVELDDPDELLFDLSKDNQLAAAKQAALDAIAKKAAEQKKRLEIRTGKEKYFKKEHQLLLEQLK